MVSYLNMQGANNRLPRCLNEIAVKAILWDRDEFIFVKPRRKKLTPASVLIQYPSTNAFRDTTDKGPPKTGLPRSLHNARGAKDGKSTAFCLVYSPSAD